MNVRFDGVSFCLADVLAVHSSKCSFSIEVAAACRLVVLIWAAPAPASLSIDVSPFSNAVNAVRMSLR